WERRQAAAVEGQKKTATNKRRIIEASIKEVEKRAAKAKDNAEREKLIGEAAELEKTLPQIPEPPRLLAEDITPEHLGTLMGLNGERMGIISDEGGFFELIAGRYNDGRMNLDLVLKSHVGSTVRVTAAAGHRYS